MRCEGCGAEYEAKTRRARFGSSQWWSAAWSRQRRDDREMIEDQFTRALTRLQI
jgi:hypothetical protein